MRSDNLKLHILFCEKKKFGNENGAPEKAPERAPEKAPEKATEKNINNISPELKLYNNFKNITFT